MSLVTVAMVLAVATAAKVKSVLAAKDLKICADLSFLSLAYILIE